MRASLLFFFLFLLFLFLFLLRTAASSAQPSRTSPFFAYKQVISMQAFESFLLSLRAVLSFVVPFFFFLVVFVSSLSLALRASDVRPL